MSDGGIALLIFGGFAVLMLFIIVKALQKQNEIDEDIANHEAETKGTLKHVDGLPLAPGVFVDVYYGPEKITFVNGKQEISVARSKIIGIDTFLGSDANSTAKSSGAVGGFILAGLPGAVLGSLAASSEYLVISYKSDDETKYIVLDVYVSGGFCKKMKKDFAKTNDAPVQEIEL